MTLGISKRRVKLSIGDKSEKQAQEKPQSNVLPMVSPICNASQADPDGKNDGRRDKPEFVLILSSVSVGCSV